MNSIPDIAAAFGLIPDSISEMSGGHINRTYHIICGTDEYVLQLIDSDVFGDAVLLEENTAKVCDACERHGVRVPQYMGYVRDGCTARLSRFIPSDGAPEPERAAYAYGSFLRAVETIAPLRCTIDGFHEIDRSYETLDREVYRIYTGAYENMARAPRRNIHGDAKLGNIIASEPYTVADLDTVMYSYAAIDYGDILRTSSTDDTDRIGVITDRFTAAAGLAQDEIRSLPYGAVFVTAELLLRYMDALRGRGSLKRTDNALERTVQLRRQLEMFVNAL